MENQVKFRLFSNKPDAPKDAPKTVDPKEAPKKQCGCKDDHPSTVTKSDSLITPPKRFTILDKPYEFIKNMRKIPNNINLQHFRIITNFLALSLGNPLVSKADSINVFDILRKILNVSGNTLPKNKLVAMSKNEVNKKAGVEPLSTKGMNKKHCCKTCPNDEFTNIKCGCSWDGTTYACAGTMCDYNYMGQCCQCDGLPNFSTC
jgi:hypothetical protein